MVQIVALVQPAVEIAEIDQPHRIEIGQQGRAGGEVQHVGQVGMLVERDRKRPGDGDHQRAREIDQQGDLIPATQRHSTSPGTIRKRPGAARAQRQARCA